MSSRSPGLRFPSPEESKRLAVPRDDGLGHADVRMTAEFYAGHMKPATLQGVFDLAAFGKREATFASESPVPSEKEEAK